MIPNLGQMIAALSLADLASAFTSFFPSRRSIHVGLTVLSKPCLRGSSHTRALPVKVEGKVSFLISAHLNENRAYVRTTRMHICCTNFWEKYSKYCLNYQQSNRCSWLKTDKDTEQKRVFLQVCICLSTGGTFLWGEALEPAMPSWGRGEGQCCLTRWWYPGSWRR